MMTIMRNHNTLSLLCHPFYHTGCASPLHFQMHLLLHFLLLVDTGGFLIKNFLFWNLRLSSTDNKIIWLVTPITKTTFRKVYIFLLSQKSIRWYEHFGWPNLDKKISLEKNNQLSNSEICVNAIKYIMHVEIFQKMRIGRFFPTCLINYWL